LPITCRSPIKRYSSLNYICYWNSIYSCTNSLCR